MYLKSFAQRECWLPSLIKIYTESKPPHPGTALPPRTAHTTHTLQTLIKATLTQLRVFIIIPNLHRVQCHRVKKAIFFTLWQCAAKRCWIKHQMQVQNAAYRNITVHFTKLIKTSIIYILTLQEIRVKLSNKFSFCKG